MRLTVAPDPGLRAIRTIAKHLDVARVRARRHNLHAFLPRAIDKVARIRASPEPGRVHAIQKCPDVLWVGRGPAMILDQQVDPCVGGLRGKLAVAVTDTVDRRWISW